MYAGGGVCTVQKLLLRVPEKRMLAAVGLFTANFIAEIVAIYQEMFVTMAFENSLEPFLQTYQDRDRTGIF